MKRSLPAIILIGGLVLSKQVFSMDIIKNDEININPIKKVALVTGSTSGIGEATALTLAREGMKVVVSGRRQELGEQVVEKIRKEGGEAHYIFADITKEDSVRNLIDQTVKHYGSIDIAINNVGMFNEAKPLAECDTAKFLELIQVNLVGNFLSMKYELEKMVPQGKGVIVNVTSIAGLRGYPLSATRAATKSALESLTKSTALQYATKNIRVNSVAPGGVETDMIDHVGGMMGMPSGFGAKMGSLHPIGRLGTVQEIADGISWLVSDKASFVTGATLVIDGGMTAK